MPVLVRAYLPPPDDDNKAVLRENHVHWGCDAAFQDEPGRGRAAPGAVDVGGRDDQAATIYEILDVGSGRLVHVDERELITN